MTDEHHAIIGSSPKLMNILNVVRKVAKTDANVLITGENGTRERADRSGNSTIVESLG